MRLIRMTQYGPLVKARCCRAWPVIFGWPMGRCGYCGRIPRAVR